MPLTDPKRTLDEAWLTKREAARRLGANPKRVYRLIEHGTLTTTRIGARDLIPAAEVDALLGGAA